MAIPRNIAAKISSPLLNIMSYMEQLVLPQNYGLGAPGGEGAQNYGTAMPARKNFKPFIVGIIPPDVPIDFIPFKKIQTSVADIQSQPFPTGANTSPSGNTAQGSGPLVTVKNKPVFGNAGLLQKTSQTSSVGDVRQSVYENFYKQSGVYPSENMVNWVTAQIMVERGGTSSSIPTTNFNFGNTHASGSRAPVGQTPTPPKGGSYYLSQDTDKDGTPYAVYYGAHTSLDDGVSAQVYYLMNNWNGAVNATTLDGYNAGLLPNGAGGHYNYHVQDQADYTRAMQIRVNQIEAGVARGQLGGHIGAAPTVDSPTFATDTIETGDQVARNIMINGTTQAESDPQGDRIGKLVQYDPDRADVVRRQTDALRAQINTLQNVPGLLLMVNPSDFTRAFEPTVDNTVKGRYGNIVHVWLERPTVISMSGVTAGQYVVDSEGNGGLAGELRTYSASYLNLLSLLSIYKTNGIIYSGPEADLGIAMLGYSVFIYFDNFIYVGSFDSFEITDADMKPHNMAYSCRFNVRYYFDAGNDGRFTDFEIGVNTGFQPQVSR
jgi:hypothetical protein